MRILFRVRVIHESNHLKTLKYLRVILYLGVSVTQDSRSLLCHYSYDTRSLCCIILFPSDTPLTNAQSLYITLCWILVLFLHIGFVSECDQHEQVNESTVEGSTWIRSLWNTIWLWNQLHMYTPFSKGLTNFNFICLWDSLWMNFKVPQNLMVTDPGHSVKGP